MTSVPAARPRIALPDIAGVSWEHPADRAALQALRAVPGFDEVARKIVAILGGERGIRLLFQGNAVRASAQQFPRLYALHVENVATFGWPEIPELYVSQTPLFNAGAYGVDHPFIVINSAALELLTEDELRVLLAHELGHIVSGHAFYRTIAAILLMISFSALPILAGIALLPIRLAILEWSRKAELSADRAGLLGSQDMRASQSLCLKMAGGVHDKMLSGEPMNLDAFVAQANEYVASNEGLDLFYKILNTLGLTHPMNTIRAAELQRWVATGDYDRILRGEYVRRGQEQKERPIRPDVEEAGAYYAREAREVADKVTQAAKKAAEAAERAFRKAQHKA